METLSKAKLKLFTSLHQKKYRYEHALFLVEGKKMVAESIESGWPLSCIIINDARKESIFNELPTLNQQESYSLPEKDFARLSTQVQAEGVIAVARIPLQTQSVPKEEAAALLLERIQDPGNLGTLLRTADWFGIRKVYCSADTVDMYNPKVLRSSMGAIFRCKCVYVKNWNAFVEEHKERIWLADMEGLAMEKHTFRPGDWILLGNEANGVSKETRKSLPDRMLTIAGSGKGESLNVGIAGGIFLHHLFAANS